MTEEEKALEIKTKEDEFSKIIHDNRDKIDRISKQQEKSNEEIVKTAEWKTFQDKYTEDIEKIDVALKKVNMVKADTVDEKKEGIKNFLNNARYQALKGGAEKGERVHNLDYFKPSEEAKAKLEMDTKAMRSDVDTRAGYLIMPPDFRMEIINQAAHEYSPIRAEATVTQTSSNSVDIPSKTARGASGWVAEGGTRSKDETLTYGMESIPLHMAYAYYDTTIEMLDDSAFPFESELKNEYSEAMNILEGTAFVSGSGIGTPEGILTNADVASTSSGDANYFTVAGLKNLQIGLKEPYWAGAKWFMKRASFGEVSLLQDGTGAYVFPDNFYSNEKNLLGHPIVFTADMPTRVAGAYPVVFGNMKKAFKIVDKNVSLMMIKDIYTSKATGIVEYLLHWRVGGQVVLAEAIKKQLIGA